MVSQHKASFLDGKDQPFTTRETDTPTDVGAKEVLIKAAALAINPVDWKIQDYGLFMKSWPVVLGEDVAGTVTQVGSSVTRFKSGDRVIGHSLFLIYQQNKYGGFQEYVTMSEDAVSLLPDKITYEAGSVLPLAISTAAAGLYQPASGGFLGLPLPKKEVENSGKAILVWGGSSSVGSLVIQLAKASGLKVAATASKRNFEYVQKIGADAVFDYNTPSIEGDVVAELQKLGDFAGVYDAISTEETVRQSAQIVAQLGGGKIVTVLPAPKDLPATVTATDVMAPSIFSNEVGKAVWHDFVPAALESGQLVPAPDALVVGHGLDSVQEAAQKNKTGVSAQKIVITL